MKKLFMATALAAVLFTACNSDNKTIETHETGVHGDMMDSGMNHMNGDHTKSNTQAGMMENATMNTVMNAYFRVKNALAKDDAKEAATAGDEVATAISSINAAGFTAAQKKMYDEVKMDIKEHAEHIGKNGDKIGHQREHFETLSKDLYDMMKVSGTNQPMYYTHCPMYNKNKGAYWLSEVKEVNNPYLGREMPGCGTVKEELK